MNAGTKFGVVHHSRWLETEEPTATVIYSHDGFRWHDICTCAPDWATEIAEALDLVANGVVDE